ncbi:hypothetical protein BDR03DRAFT_963056 [Suillus americanus]|nr:hypothetical protein BDR03DRAFT_963056 [Suillus americanus]
MRRHAPSTTSNSTRMSPSMPSSFPVIEGALLAPTATIVVLRRSLPSLCQTHPTLCRQVLTNL